MQAYKYLMWGCFVEGTSHGHWKVMRTLGFSAFSCLDRVFLWAKGLWVAWGLRVGKVSAVCGWCLLRVLGREILGWGP